MNKNAKTIETVREREREREREEYLEENASTSWARHKFSHLKCRGADPAPVLRRTDPKTSKAKPTSNL